MLDLQRLETFQAVALRLSFSEAARALHLAQPTVSTHIAHLENEFGTLLFDRSRRAITLTPAGSALLGQCQEIERCVRNTVEVVQHAASGAGGRLYIGLIPAAAAGALGLALGRFSQENPDVTLVLREQHPDDLVEGLRAGSLDVAFAYLPIAASGLSSTAVLSDELVLAVPADHVAAAEEAVALETLADDAFILPSRYAASGLNALVVAACNQAGIAPAIAPVEVWLLQTIVNLVASGMGVALIPRSVADFAPAGAVVRPLRDSVAPVTLGMVWNPSDDRPAGARFRNYVLAREVPS